MPQSDVSKQGDTKPVATTASPAPNKEEVDDRPFNDHRRIGTQQNLFFFHELSPGSCFFTPKGLHIYNTLIEFLRHEYRKRRFLEVMSPNIYNCKLWEKSGHWEHYAENMFTFDMSEHEKYSLKPMNCPGHCLIFNSTVRSWRELPLRLAEFGVLHRNEASGALTGLTRVRRFQQDDAHIFCTADQIEQEVNGSIEFMRAVYDHFDFEFSLSLSTRPESYMGELALWDKAEAALKSVLNNTGLKWELNEADGAFYGPKIDITITDSTGKPHQCATIQLDFQLPLRFDLYYVAPDSSHVKPIIVHRAIYGSIERFIAILCENYAGAWPFWLSPIQAQVVPISTKFDEYAFKVRDRLYEEGFMVDVETDPGLTLNKKVRNAQVSKYNFILVVGAKEAEQDSVCVRVNVDGKSRQATVTVEKLIQLFSEFKKNRTKNVAAEFIAACD